MLISGLTGFIDDDSRYIRRALNQQSLGVTRQSAIVPNLLAEASCSRAATNRLDFATFSGCGIRPASWISFIPVGKGRLAYSHIT